MSKVKVISLKNNTSLV